MTTSSNLILSYRNDADSGVYYVDPLYSVAGYSIDFAKTREMSEFVRILPDNSGYGYCTFEVSFDRELPVNIIGLLKTNSQQNTKVEVTLYSMAGASLYSDTFFHMFSASTYGTDSWGDFMWGGQTPISHFKGHNKQMILPLPDVYMAKKVRIRVFSSEPIDYFEFARFWAGFGYQPTYNVNYGSSIGYKDDTDKKSSKSGARAYGSVIRKRTIELDFESLEQEEFFTELFGPVVQENGISTEMLIALDATNMATIPYQSLYGNLVNADDASHAFWNHLSVNLTLEEAP